MNERLKKIEQRAEALGWKFGIDGLYFRIWPPGFLRFYYTFHIDHPEDAERLLSCYEPGPTVKIKPTCYECDMYNAGVAWDEGEVDYRDNWDPRCVFGHSIRDNNTGETVPGPDCYGPGTFKLVEVEDE